ncbi:ABC transporter substrate-binding protein [Phenylobacterium sp. VNQ135]|uniref:ABC transporter substrate-binding protein n=1 Tax=Phenylobacterium sp. VNQ135 TaxID=3400922 RepID=UPI003C064442
MAIGAQPAVGVKPTRRGLLMTLPALGLGGCGMADEGWTARAARREGEVVIYANNDVAGAVAEGFERRHPGVKVRFRELNSVGVRDAVIAEDRSGKPIADIAWSTAMDLQVKLVNDGYAQPVHLAEAAAFPRWAVWRNRGFAVTAEPVGFAYNGRLLGEVPRSHAALLLSLQRDPSAWRGKLALYDPEKSAVGFMYMSADTQIYPQGWELLEAIARSRPGLYVPGGAIMRRLSSGEHLLAYNMTLTYADWWARNRDASIRFLAPSDYHLVISSVAFIPRAAPHPHAARLFLAYLLSAEGQEKLRLGRLRPLRGYTGAESPGARHIRVGPGLLANLDEMRRTSMLERWRDALQSQPGSGSAVGSD